MPKPDVISTEVQAQAEAIEKSAWTAQVTQVSQVDASGRMDITVDYFQDGEVVYPNVSLSGSPESIVQTVQARGMELKNQKVQATQIRVGDVIEVG